MARKKKFAPNDNNLAIAYYRFSHGLHQSLDEDAFGSLRRDILGEQVNLASRVADFLFCHRQNVFVASQTVGLPHDEGMRTDFCDFRQHLLEPRSCVRGAGYCRVLILLHDFEAVRIRRHGLQRAARPVQRPQAVRL